MDTSQSPSQTPSSKWGDHEHLQHPGQNTGLLTIIKLSWVFNMFFLPAFVALFVLVLLLPFCAWGPSCNSLQINSWMQIKRKLCIYSRSPSGCWGRWLGPAPATRQPLRRDGGHSQPRRGVLRMPSHPPLAAPFSTPIIPCSPISPFLVGESSQFASLFLPHGSCQPGTRWLPMDEAAVSGLSRTQCQGRCESAHPHQAAFPGDRGSGHRASIPQGDVPGAWQPWEVFCWALDVPCPQGPQESERRPAVTITDRALALRVCGAAGRPGATRRQRSGTCY